MQRAPEFPRPSREAINQYPAKVTVLLSYRRSSKSSYFKEGRTLPNKPSTRP